MVKEEKQRLKDGLYFALAFILLIWIVKLAEIAFHLDIGRMGVFPRRAEGLTGIVTAPFIHKDFEHLFNNSVPLFIGIIGVFYFFRDVAYRIIFGIYLLSYFITWLIGRNDFPGNYHIGASGLVYGYLSFLFFGGAFAKNKNLLALSLMLIFFYGSMIWGILPSKGEISWEGHYGGAASGLLFAWLFRKKALAAPEPVLEEEDEETAEYDDSENL